MSSEDAVAIRSKLETVVSLVVPTVELEVVHDDPDDNRVLECAVEGLADAIVSGDRHLLSIGTFRDIPILRVRDFLETRP